VYDIVITMVALRLGAVEANPISAWFIDYAPGGIWLLLGMKVALCSGIVVGATHHTVQSVFATLAVWYVLGIYSFVVFFNTLIVVTRAST
jgi:hypothetical protein